MTDDRKMQAGDDPADFTNDQVNEYLATADSDELARVQQAEQDGQARVGILQGPAYAGAGAADEPEPDGNVYDEAVTREATSAFIIPSFNTIPQSVQDEEAAKRNAELEAAGVNHEQGFIGSDGAANLLG